MLIKNYYLTKTVLIAILWFEKAKLKH